MTVQQTVTCPAWCTVDPADHPDEFGVTVHRHQVGTLGVAVEQGSDEVEVAIYVPELDQHPDLSASPAFARQLGADLIAAADLVTGGAL